MGFDCLKSIITFTAVGAGESATLPHRLSHYGTALKPDRVTPDLAVFSIDPDTVTDTEVTVTNNGNSELDCRVLCEAWHPVERVFGTSENEDGSFADHLTPQPFVGNVVDPSADPPIIAGVTKEISLNVAVPLVSVDIIDTHDGSWSCKLFYAVEVTDGTDVQIRAGESNALVAYKAPATYNTAHAEDDNDAKTAGSINVAIGWSTAGGPTNIRLTATVTSTLVPTRVTLHYFILYATHDSFSYV